MILKYIIAQYSVLYTENVSILCKIYILWRGDIDVGQIKGRLIITKIVNKS